MSDSDDSEGFNFQSKVNFDEEQEQKDIDDSNNFNFKTLSELCNSFYNDIQKNDFFEHKSAWRTPSSIDPIKIQISAEETLPGICDIICPSKKNFYKKVLVALGTLILEVDNLLPNIGTTCYESLYGLSVYGEEVEIGNKNEKGNSDEVVRISRMLSYFNEIYDKINKLMSTGINLLNQLVTLYGDPKASWYPVAYKFYNFGLAFEYFGKILSYFLAIDNVVSGNEFLKDNWNKYRGMLYQIKGNVGEYNMSEEQKKKLYKFVKRVNAPIFENTCYKQCVEIIIKKCGKISSSGQGMTPIAQCKTFFEHFNKYMASKINKINSNLDKLTQTYEPIETFQYLSLLGFYITLTGINADKNILKSAWQVQKKIFNINIVGISYFNIENFLKGYREYNNISVEPSNVQKQLKSNLTNLEKQFDIMINNYYKNIISWVTKMDSVFSNANDFAPKKEKNPKLYESCTKKIKLIIDGLCTANYLKNNIAFILDSHYSLGIGLDEELINQITSGLELIKVVEFEFSKMMNLISLNIPLLTRSLLTPIQAIIKKVAEKAQIKYKNGKSTNEQLYKDALSACSIFYTCTQYIQSELRLVIEKLCLSTISAKEMIDKPNYELINDNLWMAELINQLSRELKRSCDCSFLYLYQDILPDAFKNIYSDTPKRIYYFVMAVNDIENPLHYIKYKENDGIDTIKNLRKITFDSFENIFLKKLAEEIVNDLIMQVHGTFIEGLEGFDYTEKNLNSFLNIKNFRFFDRVIDIKRYIEEELNLRFYKLTTLNLKNNQTYQRMRVLAKSKYNLNLHDVYLPNQNLEQGKDLLDIVRNLATFSKTYTHNLHSQQFIELVKDANYINVIGVQQILSSLYTHGKGIINTIINRAFGFISKNVGSIIDIIRNDYILAMLIDERNFWEKNKAEIKYNYPLENAKNLRQKIINNDDNKNNGKITKSIKLITQIGNIVSLIRCIKTALMDYNSQNVNLLTSYNIDDFNKLIDQISLQVNDDPNSLSSQISQNTITNTQNSLVETSKLFCKTISSLKQTGENEKDINYFEVLINAFRPSINLEKIPNIDLFAFLLPPLTLTFIDNAINARDTLLKKKKTDESLYFSDDGFIMGMCYLLKLFLADKKFESLNWFSSVIEFYNSKKGDKKVDKYTGGVDTLNDRESASYKEQFELQFFTYTTASILFMD